MKTCLRSVLSTVCATLTLVGVDRIAAQVPVPGPENGLIQPSEVIGGELPTLEMTQRIQQLEANQQRLEAIMGQPLGQDVPGETYSRNLRELPDYVYSPGYFNRPGVGARAIADYAPPGYEARDQQEGPAEPEYERIFAPTRVGDQDRDDFVTRGLYPGSFLVPGTATSVRLRGFVRLAGLYDFDPIGVPDAFVTNTIPVPQQIGENFNVSARISRFALETWTPTSFCDWNVHTFIEGDFFNGPGQAAGGGGNPLRLRHAFFDFGYFRFGQQNTVFMDGSNWPSLVDFQGPNSWVNQRQPSMRVTLPIGNRLYWATSVERPFSDITAVDGSGASLGRNVQNVPDFATHLRYEGNRGHLQLAGLWRSIAYRPFDSQVDRSTAAAISGNVVLHPWAFLLGTDPVTDTNPSAWTRSRISMQGTLGNGVGRYLNDLSGQGLDAIVDPTTGRLNLVEASGWNASYEQWFSSQVLSNFTYAQVSVDPETGAAASTYDSTDYLAASLWWIPVPRLSLAVEYMWGERVNFDGQSGNAERLHALAQYNF